TASSAITAARSGARAKVAAAVRSPSACPGGPRHSERRGETMTTANNHSVLLVDYEPEMLYSLRGFLPRGLELHTAESGAEALDILHRQPVEVIMTDQRMPQMTGVELLRRAQGECPEAIRIVFTGYADIKAVIDAINQGHVYRFLTKPWDP